MATNAAFTDATLQRVGKFEQCNRSTLFLDEIGDMTPTTQTKILRVLQSGAQSAWAGTCRSRWMSASSPPRTSRWSRRSRHRQFREDLFYRLNVVRVFVLPEAQRREDIRLLVNYFLKTFAKDQQHPPKSIAPSVLRALEKYHWPGNVRELENVVRRALVVAKGDAV